MTDEKLHDFIAESNRIERITRPPTDDEVRAHERLLRLREVAVADLEDFVGACASAPLRDRPGMNVRVGAHLPPSGGPHIATQLQALLRRMHTLDLTPYAAHHVYESLHPFMDGNGRSGRALWAWHMRYEGRDPFALPFLRLWYYESLTAARRG